MSQSTAASLDLSNLDLMNFKFFKYPHQPQYQRHNTANLPENYRNQISSLQKVKAMFKYFSGVLFGSLQTTQEIPIVFHPEAAKVWRTQFQKKWGPHGKHLIEMLGKGYQKKDLIYYDAHAEE